MFKRVLVHEMKTMTRDKMYMFLLLYPLIMALVAYFLVPYLRDLGSDLAADIVTLLFILINSFMFGAITGFTLLDDQDDNVILSLRITPINVKYYVFIKLAVSYILGVFSTVLLVLVTGFLSNASFIDFVYIILLVSMQGPIFALLINSFATNKVEGFVIMKLSGIILMVPIASLFLTNWTELFLGVLPGFWPARLVSMQLIPGDYLLKSSTLYFIIGLIVNLLLGLLFFKLYSKRVKI
ncbi:MAG: ABC transporter permease [Acholeplasmataceae bacterium]|nr:ABC transporter permease [Acholeplasmataceae bacterium]